MPSRHFGNADEPERTSAPNHGRIRFLKPLPHGGDECGCYKCDQIRKDNGMARTSVNWSIDYPPSFYGRIEVEEDGPIDWTAEFKDWEQ
jgi:hypothetical protein